MNTVKITVCFPQTVVKTIDDAVRRGDASSRTNVVVAAVSYGYCLSAGGLIPAPGKEYTNDGSMTPVSISIPIGLKARVDKTGGHTPTAKLVRFYVDQYLTDYAALFDQQEPAEDQSGGKDEDREKGGCRDDPPL